ncbi:MAG: type II toxin-antitoxin system antitoxin SocA domain-containing protein [Candidatus Gracilibacteria bacterium]|jgi:uncharacterized phage-associated protein
MATKVDENMAINLARYFLYRANFDGETITPLKMQKLLYYAYVWVLIKKGNCMFDEKFQAWPRGPVLPSLYKKLKKFEGRGIDPSFIELGDEDDLEELKKSFPEGTLEIIDKVYDQYIVRNAFELVTMTHNEKPWKRARQELPPTAHSTTEISDEDIIEEYGKRE